MKLFALAFSAVVGLAAAQMEVLSEIPQCALECFTSSILKTDCALTDFYCQCGPNSASIQKDTLSCLCESECTTSDLAKVYSLSGDLCSKTLAEHGETYDMPDASLSAGICHDKDAPAVQAAAGSGSAASNSTGTAQPSNGTTASAPKATGTGADFEGAASAFGMSVAAIAVGGLAFMI